MLDRHGATRYRDAAAQELRRLGARTPRPKRGRDAIGEGIGSLSEREGDVARLVAEGLTNKKIAAELYLSEKTIEKHIARIFDKLGVSTRTQIATAIGRESEAAR
jgi:DNA-binding NarL/FixJ family response regulator